MKVLYVIAFVLLGMATVVSAQENGNIEQLLDANDVVRSDEQYEDMLAVLQKLWMAPLNLNTADFDSLKLLFFLSDSQIDNILAFRKRYGIINKCGHIILYILLCLENG